MKDRDGAIAPCRDEHSASGNQDETLAQGATTATSFSTADSYETIHILRS